MRASGTCNLILIATFWSKIYFLKFAYSALYKLLYVRYGTGIRGVKEITSTFRPTHTHTHIFVCVRHKSLYGKWKTNQLDFGWMALRCGYCQNVYSACEQTIYTIKSIHLSLRYPRRICRDLLYTYMAKAISSNITCVRLRCDSYSYMYWIYNYKL